MIFSILIIVLLGVVAFFHYVQGFFSATISAMICVLAAVLALGYDETVVNFLLKGKMADQAHALVLCMIFAVVYFVLRTIFDTAVPGNVRVPATVDKIGAAIMGIIAGIFVTGIFAITVEMLPFDPGLSFMGYSRYAIKDNPKNPDVLLPSPGGSQAKDTSVYSEMEDASMEPDKQKTLLIPVDDMVLSAVYHLSDGGSLAGDRSLASVHPDYLTELFGERLGIQVGARRSALYQPGSGGVDVTGIFTAKSLPAADGQVIELRPTGYKSKSEVRPGPGQTILVVRVKVAGNVSDDPDNVFRFSTGSVRLVGPTSQGTYKDFFPVGTLENAQMVLLNKPDDFLFMNGGQAFDAVFVVDDSLIVKGTPQSHLAPGVFISVKRFATLDLNGQSIKDTITPDPSVQLIRNKLVLDRAKVPPALATPVAPAAASPAESRDSRAAAAAPTPAVPDVSAMPVTPAAVQPTPGKDISDTLSVTANPGFLVAGSIALGTSSADPDAKNAPVAGGTMNLKGGNILSATVDPTASLTALSQGVQGGSQFYTPTDRTLVQAVIHPYQSDWSWISQLSSTALIDSNGNSFPLSGFYAMASNSDSRGLFLRYDSAHALPAVSPPDGSLQSDIYLIFLIPHETDIKTLKLGGKQQNLDSVLHVP